jgi:sirohydrochlorin ferrochelatase
MIRGTLMLTGRQTERVERTIETHAARLRDRDVAETVVTERFDGANGERRADEHVELDDEDVYVVPMTTARTTETEEVIRLIASAVADAAVICNPIGRSPAVTEVIADRATDHFEPSADTSLVLVGLGSSFLPYQRRVVEYHRCRLAARTAYGEVTASYLLQDPAVECVPYNVSGEDVVAVPVFVTPSEVTREAIPDRLDLGSADIAYADPLGIHPRLTDAIQAEVTKRHVLESQDAERGQPVNDGVLNYASRPHRD